MRNPVKFTDEWDFSAVYEAGARGEFVNGWRDSNEGE
jgi:hypothetical protein